jgi:hypothetical protein
MEAFPAWYLILVIFGPFVIGALVILAGLFLWRRSRKIALAVIAVPLLVFLAPPLVGWVQFKLDDYYLRSLIVRAPEASLPKGAALVLHHDGRLCAGICEGLSYDQFTEVYGLRSPRA